MILEYRWLLMRPWPDSVSLRAHFHGYSGSVSLSGPASPLTEQPTVWVVRGDKAGDNAQLATLVRQLPCAVQVKTLRFKKPFVTGKPLFFGAMYHVDRSRSDPLQPPWPDLVVTAGSRPAMAALWIKKRSRGSTKVVLLGRPKRWLHVFDLIVASAQYPLPPRDNIVPIALPLLDVDADRVRRAQAEWHDRLDQLPRPLVAVLVGGVTRPYRFDADAARTLLRRAGRYVEGSGTLYVVTSRRTPAAALQALADELPAGAKLFDWQRDSDNPYWALLAGADCAVVTGDSVSMMTEVARLGTPQLIFELPERRSRLTELVNRMLGGVDWSRPSAWQRGCARIGFASFPRDLKHVHAWLYERGHAAPLGSPIPARVSAPCSDAGRIAARVLGLLEADAGSCS